MTAVPGSIFIGAGDSAQHLLLKRANRHGLIAGATGTGKTVTLRILAEGFAANGVPVLITDVKGDLATMTQAGELRPAFLKRAAQIGLQDYTARAFPGVFWDVFGKLGHPVRTTISEMGPLLLAELLGLNETQEGVLSVAFAAADDNGMLLLDLKDLRAMLGFITDNAADISREYGNVSKASIGAIQRRLLGLEREGGEVFFGEPALDIQDLMRVDSDGIGHVNVLDATRLMQETKLYSAFLLWLLSELFEELPEVGDPDKPCFVMFLDEAHLLFDKTAEALQEKIEQVVRLIRSKGVGVYFCTQSPTDIPDEVLGQLGNRFQHALRAFTPRDQKAVKAAATTFRANPALDVKAVITQLGVGEALVSTLDEKGSPTVVERTLIRPPCSLLGSLSEAERKRLLAASEFSGRYDEPTDRESAFEKLQQRAERAVREAPAGEQREKREPARKPARRGRARQSVLEAMTKSVVRSLGSSLGRQLARGLLGSLLKR